MMRLGDRARTSRRPTRTTPYSSTRTRTTRTSAGRTSGAPSVAPRIRRRATTIATMTTVRAELRVLLRPSGQRRRDRAETTGGVASGSRTSRWATVNRRDPGGTRGGRRGGMPFRCEACGEALGTVDDGESRRRSGRRRRRVPSTVAGNDTRRVLRRIARRTRVGSVISLRRSESQPDAARESKRPSSASASRGLCTQRNPSSSSPAAASLLAESLARPLIGLGRVFRVPVVFASSSPHPSSSRRAGVAPEVRLERVPPRGFPIRARPHVHRAG